jgi:hypothetical protein
MTVLAKANKNLPDGHYQFTVKMVGSDTDICWKTIR